MTDIYELPLRQTWSGGNGERQGEHHQPHLLLGWSNTPGRPIAHLEEEQDAAFIVCKNVAVFDGVNSRGNLTMTKCPKSIQ